MWFWVSSVRARYRTPKQNRSPVGLLFCFGARALLFPRGFAAAPRGNGGMPPNPQPYGLPCTVASVGPLEAFFGPKAISFMPFRPSVTHFWSRHCKYLNGQPRLDTIESFFICTNTWFAGVRNYTTPPLERFPFAVQGQQAKGNGTSGNESEEYRLPFLQRINGLPDG